MSSMTLNDLQALALIDERGSIGAVAQALGVSQPTVSVMLKKLESRLGFAVLERSPTGSALTGRAKVILEAAVPILEGIALLEQTIAALRGEPTALRVAASLTIAEYLIPQWISQLTPSIRDEIEVTVCNSEAVMDRIQDRSADLGFVEGPRVRGSMRGFVIGEDTLRVVVAPNHEWAGRARPISVAQLVRAELALREPGSGTREVFIDALRQLGQQPPSHSTTLGSTSALKNWVKQGRGVAILSGLAVQEEIDGKTLIEVRVRDLNMRRTLHAVVAGLSPLDERATLLLQAAAAQHPARSA